MSLFACTDYKEFVRDQIQANRSIRGYQTLLANGAGCQRTYLSQVLHSEIHLTPDHAANLGLFWKMEQDEKEYFLELVNLARAGTKPLLELTRNRLREIRNRRLDLTNRFNAARIEAEETPYYSSWIWSALHVLVSIPEFQTVENMSRRLELPAVTVVRFLMTLKEMGLVQEKDGSWTSIQTDLHLSRHSPWNAIHHNNWRQRAVLNSQLCSLEDLHYTAVVSMSRKDFGRVKELLVEAIEKKRRVVVNSPEEDVFCVGVDLFRV